MTVQTIILSKDRAVQLDLLLRSLKLFVADWKREFRVTILWRASTDEFAAGYRDVMEDHPEFGYREEEVIRQDIPACLNGAPYLQFLMDDDVYVRPFSVQDKEVERFAGDERICALVPRMAPYMDYCYTENVKTGAPWFGKGRLWAWPGLRGDWGYPHSVDGSVWRTADVESVIRTGEWSMLHNLEPALRAAMSGPLAICYAEPRLLNVAANSVQDVVPANRHGGVDPAALNKRYLAGERIALANIRSAHPHSPHFEIDFEWEAG